MGLITIDDDGNMNINDSPILSPTNHNSNIEDGEMDEAKTF